MRISEMREGYRPVVDYRVDASFEACAARLDAGGYSWPGDELSLVSLDLGIARRLEVAMARRRAVADLSGALSDFSRCS